MTETTVWKHKENMLVKRREPSLWFAAIANLKRISDSLPSLLLPHAHVLYILYHSI